MLNVESMLAYKLLASLKSNPSQTMAAFIKSEMNLQENAYHSDIWLFDGSDCRQLTTTTEENSFIFEDDTHILFQAARTNQEKQDKGKGILESHFYRIDINGGEAQKAFTLPLMVHEIKPLADQCYLVLAETSVEDFDLFKKTRKKREAVAENKKANNFVTSLDEIPFCFNGLGFISGQRQSLFYYNAKKDQLKCLTKPHFSVSAVSLNEDKSKALIIGNTIKNKLEYTTRLYELNLKNNKITELYRATDFVMSHAFYKEDEILILANDMTQIGLNQNDRLYTYDYKNETLEKISEEEITWGNSLCSDISFGASDMVCAKNDIHYISTREDYTRLIRIDKLKEIQILFEVKGSINAFIHLNEKCYAIMQFQNKLQDIYEIEIEEKREEIITDLIQVTHFNEETLSDFYIADAKYLEFNSNGDKIQGWVLLPENFDKKKNYPAILDIHGGPKTAYGCAFLHEMQVWVNQGYVVMYCNPHGSDGRGDRFSDIRGRYGEIDYEDIMCFVKLVLEKYPNVDKKRLGVTGGSYGGFMTNWIITQTNLFKAAATQRSIMNWTSFYGTSDIGYFFVGDQNDCESTADDGFMKMWDHSPLKYVNQVKTPTLIIHSALDYRCPIEQGYQLFTALKDRGIDSKMLVFHEENHELSRSGKPKARIERLKQLTAWFNTYLKKH